MFAASLVGCSNMTERGIKCGLDPGDESQCRASALTYSITEIAILTPLNDTLITFSYGSVFSETSCYSNGNDSPHRRTVTPLLRALGCVRWARKVGVHFSSDVWYMFPHNIAPSPGGSGLPSKTCFLAPRESASPDNISIGSSLRNRLVKNIASIFAQS